MLSCHCFVEWQATCSNLVEYDHQLHNDDGDATSFVFIHLPLSKFSLTNSILISLFSILTLLAGGTKTVVLEEAVLEEERPYPKPVRSEADFYMLSISSNFALEVLSS